MKAVFSFYSQPYNFNVKANKSNWTSIEMEFIVFGWAVSRAKQLFDSVELVTDSYGRELFNELGIVFDSYRVFSNIEPFGGKLWAAGKMEAYRVQSEPFCHIDGDAFFQGELPIWIKANPITTQSWDDTMGNAWYYDTFVSCIRNTKNEYPYDLFHNCKNRVRFGSCMSVYACNDLEVNKSYTDRFQAILETSWYKSLPNNYRYNSHFNVLFEQLMLSEEYFQMRGKLHNVLLNKDEIFMPVNSAKFTHIWGNKGKLNEKSVLYDHINKKNPQLVENVKKYF